MMKRVIGAGLLGGMVLIVWTFVVNGLFGLQASIDMKPIPAEQQVYRTLKEHIVHPGRYICNPGLDADGRFPPGEPVFSVIRGGMGHESAGGLMLFGLALFFLAPMIGAWLLSRASRRVLASYPRKVLFFVCLGLLAALVGDLHAFGIGGYPLRDTLILAANSIIVWTLVGLAAAWRLKPGPADA
jgi:hypothetical protein